MKENDTLEQARLIFSTGKMIRDRMVRVHGQSHSTEEPAMCGDLSVAQLHVVIATKDRGQVSISELAEALGVSAPSASAMVDRLVDKGVLIREQSQEDRRRVVVRLSPEADKQFGKIEELMLQSFVYLIEKVGPQTTRKWCEVLQEVREVILRDGWDNRPLMKEEGKSA